MGVPQPTTERHDMNKPISRHPLTALALAAATALTLGACGRSEEPTVGQQIDSAISKTEKAAAEAKAEVKQEAAEARDAASRAAEQLAGKTEKAAEAVSQGVSDAAITASINAELARDPGLSALRIDVDTSGGQVRLSGTAPTAEARARATQLAQSVKGVTGVDNRLRVGS